jgi:uridine phosphorylase
MKRLISSEQILAAARINGLDDEELHLQGIAILTFLRPVMEHLEARCGLKDATWLGPQHHPYTAARIVKRGQFESLSVTALVPPMGSSPLACIVEDLAACGVQAVFLVCAAWSLGPPVAFGDLIIPAFSLGPDGTSIHYGNEHGRVQGPQAVVRALAAACQSRGRRHHIGGTATCEALYRITPEMAGRFRQQGCLCMDNGEASTLFAVSHTCGILGGVLFQTYIDLEKGWDPLRLRDERYRQAGEDQAEVVLQTSLHLQKQGLLA